MPASRSFLRWWLRVGWEISNSGTSSQTQTLPACLRSTSTSCSRIGSPSALVTSAVNGAIDREGRPGEAARRGGNVELYAEAGLRSTFVSIGEENVERERVSDRFPTFPSVRC